MDTSVANQQNSVGQWNEDDHSIGSVINIQPLPEINGDVSDDSATKNQANFPIEASVTIAKNSPRGNCVFHTVETHTQPMDTTRDVQSPPIVPSNSADRVPKAGGSEKQGTVANVDLVVKTEPGLEKANHASKATEEQKPQPTATVVKAEKDSSDYEKSVAKHSGKPASESATNSAPPKPQTEPVADSKVCTICSRILSSPESCVSHISNHSKEGFRMFECDVCGWAFESQMQFNVHKKKHSKRTATPSAKPSEGSGTLKVNFPFKKAPGTKKTTKPPSDNSEDSLTCLFCGRVLTSRETLKEHQERHCDEQFTFIQCPDCDACFEDKSTLMQHRKNDHKDNSPLPDQINEAYLSYACEICKRTFKTEGKLEEHTENHSNGTKLHQCTECGFCFEGQGDLKVHRRNKHKQKYGPKLYNVPCNECSRPFKNDVDMETHLENHYNGTKLHVCSECGFAFENQSTMQTHRYEKHVKPMNTPKTPKRKKPVLDPEVLNRSCQICERICPDEALKDAHVLNHHSNMPMMKCSVCSWEFEDQESYAEHKETHSKKSGPGQHICNTCTRKFKSEEKKFAHIQNHNNDVTMYKCETCPFEFEDDQECAQHEQKCGKGKKNTKKDKKDSLKFSCDFCDRKFQSETIKAMHMTRHLGNEPMHKCVECGWQFEQIHQMTYHLKSHKTGKKTPSKKTPRKEEKEKPNTVCDQCERQFYYERQMLTHRENHFNSSQLFKCRYCPWQYEKETSIPRHVEQYHPFYAEKSEFSKDKRRSGQKINCPLCGRIFMGKAIYVQHLANHTELPYKCPYDKCGWFYSDYKQFQSHKSSKHNEFQDDTKYRLEKMAEEANATGDSTKLEENLKVLNEPADPGKSISFALMCPRCKEWFSNKKEHHNHAMKCKASYTCRTCDLLFDNFNEFELHLIEDEMECEVCKGRFASECVLQKHLVAKHFSADMIGESEKQQNEVQEGKKKAEAEAEKIKAEAAKLKADAAKAAQQKSIASPKKTPNTPTPSSIKSEITPKSAKQTPTRASTRSKTAPTHTVSRSDERDNTCDENVVSSSTADSTDGNSDSAQKRKRVASTDSNTVDSSDDPSSAKRIKLQDDSCGGELNTVQKKVIVCEVLDCHGAFFDEHIYVEHVRKIHADCINVTSDDKYIVMQVKDALRTNPTKNKPGPASRMKKIWSLLRIQCIQGECKESNASYFAVRSLYSKHVAEVHGESTGKITGTAESKKSLGTTEKSEDPLVQSTVTTPRGGSDAEDESPEKRSKMEEEALKKMMSESSYSSLLKDLDSMKKGYATGKKD